MRTSALIAIGSCIALSGCVFGSGACLFQQPFKHTLVGTIHFRSYPAGDGIDHVPILSLDETAYIYAPANSHLCLAANDLQLVGWSEFPPDIAENTRIEVEGSIFQAASMHQHTPFLLTVRNILPIGAAPPAAAAPPEAPEAGAAR
ncbi:MAG: hypothetical protein ACLP0B_17155 [Steroidobacteraceae bacterium]|jgi:hypothetical protein